MRARCPQELCLAPGRVSDMACARRWGSLMSLLSPVCSLALALAGGDFARQNCNRRPDCDYVVGRQDLHFARSAEGLESLTIRHVRNQEFPPDMLQTLSARQRERLQLLIIADCPNLKRLPPDLLRGLVGLRSIELKELNALVSPRVARWCCPLLLLLLLPSLLFYGQRASGVR